MKLKYIFTLIVTFGLFLSIKAQSFTNSTDKTEVKYLTTSISNMNLVINWKSEIENSNDSWEVQGSSDGYTFNTIGIVLGVDPMNPEVYSFKQKLKKIKSGYIYFRVMHIIDNATGKDIAHIIK